MKLNELTDKLQGLCYEGHAEDEIRISIWDGIYKIENLKHIQIPKDENITKSVFLLEAEMK